MRYEEIKERSDRNFKWLTGIEHNTFRRMVTVLETEMPSFGRPPKLSRADQFSIVKWITFRLTNTTVCRTIQEVEIGLIQSGQFRLPGKKALQPSDTIIEIVIVDATEQPIERPKKSNVDTTVASRNDILRKPQ